MSNYYCLVAGLPEIAFDDGKSVLTSETFRKEIYPQLTGADRKVVDLFYLESDNRNFFALLKNREAAIPEGEEGNFTAEDFLQLFDSVKNEEKYKGRLPLYFLKFYHYYLEQVKSGNELVMPYMEDRLSSLYYDYCMKCGNAFARSWFEFNLNVCNIFIASVARRYKMEVAPHVVGDTKVCDKIRKSMARDFDLSTELDYVEDVIRISETAQLTDREKKFDILRWNWIEDNTFFEYFSLEKVLSYLLKIKIAERWNRMDKEAGRKKFREIIDNLKDEVRIPDDFRK